jgi:hypothetical protein
MRQIEHFFALLILVGFVTFPKRLFDSDFNGGQAIANTGTSAGENNSVQILCDQ